MKFDKYAEKYDLGFMGKCSRRFYIDLIKELDIEDGNCVLDVGCGTGNILAYIGKKNEINGYGLDISENMIKIAKQKNNKYNFIVGDSSKLPYDDESMDVVIACMAYHHFPNQEKFRQEALRVLKPRGMLYISDPRFPLFVRKIFNFCFKEAGFYSTNKNKKDFEECDFTTINRKKDLYVQVLKFKKLH